MRARRTVLSASYVVNCTAEYGMICDHVAVCSAQAPSSAPRGAALTRAQLIPLPFMNPAKPSSLYIRTLRVGQAVCQSAHTHTHTHTRTRKNAQRIPHAAIRLALCARRVRASCTATGRLVRLNLEDDLEPFERTYDGTTCRAGEAAYSGQGKMSRDLVRAPPRGMRRGGEDAPATKYVNIN